MAAMTPRPSNKGLMGVGLTSGGAPYLFVLHAVGLGLLGWSIAEQRQLRYQVLELQATFEHHHLLSPPVSTSTEPPTPPPVGSPSSAPTFPDAGLRVPVGACSRADSGLSGFGFFTLGLVLLALLFIGIFIGRGRHCTRSVEEPGTPHSKHQLAQRTGRAAIEEAWL